MTCREKPRVVSDKEPSGQCGMVSFNELRSIHEQLSLVHPSLQPYLPDLPVEIQGYWSYIYQNEEPDPSLCGKLEKYFTIAVEICGHSLVISTLFEEHSYDEDRFIMLGLSLKIRVLIVCYCERRNGDLIRIISARKATRYESQNYAGGIF